MNKRNVSFAFESEGSSTSDAADPTQQEDSSEQPDSKRRRVESDDASSETADARDARSIRSIQRKHGFEQDSAVLGREEVDRATGRLRHIEGEANAAQDRDTAAGDDIEAKERYTYGTRVFDEYEGVMLDPFNLAAEREGGYFDASGNYVRSDVEARRKRQKQEQDERKQKKYYQEEEILSGGKKKAAPASRGGKRAADDSSDEEENGPGDTWVNDLEDSEIRVAGTGILTAEYIRKIYDRKESEQRRRREKDRQLSMLDETELKKQILKLLDSSNPEESVQDALSRLGSSGDDADKAAFQSLNDLATKMTQLGDFEIYGKTRAELWKYVSKTFPVVYWYYKWSTDAPDTEVYGPYDTATMLAWKQAGMFEGYEIVVRAAAPSSTTSTTAATVADDDDDMFADEAPATSKAADAAGVPTGLAYWKPLAEVDLHEYR